MSVDVMVLDDSSVMRKIVIRSLRASGLSLGSVLEGANGEEGLAHLQNGQRPRLIVSDINMNGMDGISFVKEARRLVSPSQTSIVMVTTESGTDRIRAALAAGATAYLTKPFSPDQLGEHLGGLM